MQTMLQLNEICRVGGMTHDISTNTPTGMLII
jgi:hypothetical protein